MSNKQFFKNSFSAGNSLEFAENSAEFRFFHFGIFENKEFTYTPTPEGFLRQYSPERIDLLRRVLKKIKFNFKGEFITNLLTPANIGGYFSPTENVISISPYLLLHGSEKEIAHVLFHEGLHAGIYSEGTNLMEEVVVETMTKKKMDEIYGGNEFQSGYDGMVKEASEFFGELSYQEMMDKVEEGNEQTFDNYLELMLISPSIVEKDIKNLSWNSISNNMGKRWGMLKRLFPRMINSIAKNNKGLHEEAHMSAYQYKLEGLLQKCAKRVISENQDLITEILLETTDKGSKNLQKEELKNAIFKAGYGYIYDQEPELVEKMIGNFLLQVNIANFNGTKLEAANINLNLFSFQ